VLLNYYTVKGKIGWHMDRLRGLTPEQNHKLRDPIVSFSLGDRALFSYKDLNNGNIWYLMNVTVSLEEQDLILESGDIVVFGGPSRPMFHTIKKVYANTTPSKITMRNFPGRFNITFREGAYYY
jgi:alkylated DNA repair dioxygenase AlkB